MPPPEYLVQSDGHRICAYCNRHWTATHDCEQSRLVRHGLEMEHIAAVRTERQEGRRARRRDRSRRRRQVDTMQAAYNNQIRKTMDLFRVLQQIVDHPGGYDSGGHCGCFYALKDIAREAIVRALQTNNSEPTA